MGRRGSQSILLAFPPQVWVHFLVQIPWGPLNTALGEPLSQGLCSHQPCDHDRPLRQLGYGDLQFGSRTHNPLAQLPRFREKTQPKTKKWPVGHFNWGAEGHEVPEIHALK